ncbi:GNAT family N-acetyltransferase [Dyadobacter sediminis]|nr:GNAT family N-acetyltransferase [Dyadobacter sediminis]GGB88536.1 hypothetical protein GCM10011325_15080 [Dyadobacter sediminis]
MTPILVNRSQISDLLWNNHIQRSQQSVVYAYSFYLDSVCIEWKALVWPSEEDYQVVMPLPVRTKAGKMIVYQPLFCQYLGLFTVNSLTSPQVEAFLTSLSSHFSYISAYSFNPDNYRLVNIGSFRFNELKFQEQSTYYLRLGHDYSKIYNHYSKDRQRNVERSRRYNWTLEQSTDINPLIHLFKENHASRIFGGVNPDAYARLQLLFERLNLHEKAEIWYAVKEGRIHAGILLVRNCNRIIYLFNAADKIGRSGNARTFLLDCYFKVHASKPMIFDFESPEVSSIASFYNSFGSIENSYMMIRKNQLVFPFRQIQEWRRNLMLKTR